MKAGVVLAVVLLASGCTPGQPATSSPSDSAFPAPTQASSPVAVFDPTTTPVNFRCRLPVVITSKGGAGVEYDGGFVTFPSATLQMDPLGKILAPYGQTDFSTAATPVLHGQPQSGTPFYDLAQRRWIPASAAQTTPDGSQYAYATVGSAGAESGTVHVVDVGLGTERLFPVSIPNGGPDLAVADFASDGVYLVAGQRESYPSGVWLLDVRTGSVRPLAQVSGVMLVRDGIAWVGRIDPRDPGPPAAGSSGQLFDSIVSVELRSGTQTIWYYRPGRSVVLQGLDGFGRLIVGVGSGSVEASEIVLVDGGSANPASNRSLGTLIHTGGPPFLAIQRDSYRTWFGSSYGIYLYDEQGGDYASAGIVGSQVIKVLNYDFGSPQSGAINPAGFCV